MRSIRNFKTIFGGIAAIALLAAATIIVAEETVSKKSTYEQKIEDIMVEYVKLIQYAENSHDKKIGFVIKAARTIRDGAVEKAGQVLLARLERAAKDSRRLGRTADAELAEEKIAEFKKLIEQAKAADPDKLEVEDKDEIVLEGPPLASHVVFGGHAYLAIMGEYTFFDAQTICKRIGGNLACIGSIREMLFLQKNLPVRHTLWVGASDPRRRGQWLWVNGQRVGAGYWADGHPRAPVRPTYIKKDRFWRNIHAALAGNGMITRDQNSKCRGFICEWGR